MELRSLSDHAALSLTMTLPTVCRPFGPWQIHVTLLHRPELVTQVPRALTNFLELNDTPDICISTLWDTLKATTRGELITISVADNKCHCEKREHLSRKGRELEHMHLRTGTPKILCQLEATHKQLVGLDLDKAEYATLRFRHTFYIGGDKCGWVLEHSNRQGRYIPWRQ
ncbi:hypothetical protein NDU88_001949 [Pleurodeles waltl]|uniref:Uncharacterized protein n=1 Tax=Pleurodeles waltl TaxID=8319 RepID=A0AAV7NEX8_PLEWA|nr:hypothetical protein NDU88_001949 [Pleurodeles waltl]